MSLAFAEQHECTHVLVVTINSKAVETIDDEGSWHQWSSRSSMNWEILSKGASSFAADEHQIFITNYESLFKRGKNKQSRMTLSDNVLNFLNACKHQNVALIIDESHKVKNLQSQQSLALQKIQSTLEKSANCYTYLLTGTPFTKGYIDLYAQLKMLGSTYTKQQFINDFCIMGNIPGLLGYQQPIVGYKNKDELFKLVHNYAITIETKDVLELPEQVFINHTLPQSADFNMYVNEFVDTNVLKTYAKHRKVDVELSKTKRSANPFFRNIDYPSSLWVAETSGSFWLRARQLSIGFQGNADYSEWYDRRRLNQLSEFLKEHEDNYVLFYNFTPELLELYDICEKLDYNIDVYCGEIKSLHFYNRFCELDESEQLTAKKNIILANFASGSTGMNWQKYNHCIIFSVPIYKDYAQGIKRIHRTGQQRTTFYHTFYQNNWLDINMNRCLHEAQDYNFRLFETDLQRVQTLTMKGEM